MEDKHWAKKAFANAHGQFAARAKHAGMSTAAYARHVLAHKKDFGTHVRRQAQLALTGIKMSRNR